MYVVLDVSSINRYGLVTHHMFIFRMLINMVHFDEILIRVVELHSSVVAATYEICK